MSMRTNKIFQSKKSFLSPQSQQKSESSDDSVSYPQNVTTSTLSIANITALKASHSMKVVDEESTNPKTSNISSTRTSITSATTNSSSISNISIDNDD